MLDVLSDVNFRVARTADDPPQIIHHDRVNKIEQREKPNIKWVFEQSRTLQRKKANQGDGTETMAAVLDRLTKLENSTKYAKRKYKRRGEQPQNEDAIPQVPAAEARIEEPQQVRKRGRPRKKKVRTPKRVQKRERLIEPTVKDRKAHKPEVRSETPKGLRRSARLKKTDSTK